MTRLPERNSMRRLLSALAVLLILGAPRADAQSREEPNLIFSINFGLTTGKELWTIPRQPLIAPAGAEDTVALGRRLRPGLTGIVSATLFRSPRLGYTAEVGYYGLASEQRCAGPAAWAPDSNDVNQQGCERAHGKHLATSVVGFQAGLHYRLLQTGRFQAFLRGTGGLGLIGNSYVQTSGLVVVPPNCTPSPCDLRLVDEADRRSLTWIASLTAGFSVSVAPGYRLKMELRDIITSVPVATGPAAANSAIAPTGSRTVHVPTFMFGLDLVFERRHARRY